jgi:hypothetical protein
LTFGGACLSFMIYNTIEKSWQDFILSIKISSFGKFLYTFLNRKWFFDKVYNEWVNQNILNIGYKETYQNIDRGLIEIFGPQGFSSFLYTNINHWNQIRMSFLYHYLLVILYSYLVLIFIFLIPFNFIWYFKLSYIFEIILLSYVIFTTIEQKN